MDAIWQGGNMMIQILHITGEPKEMNLEGRFPSVVEFIFKQQGITEDMDVKWGEIEKTTLANYGNLPALSQEAFITQRGIHIRYVGYIYENRYYMGVFMWMDFLDKAHRQEIQEAIALPGARL